MADEEQKDTDDTDYEELFKECADTESEWNPTLHELMAKGMENCIGPDRGIVIYRCLVLGEAVAFRSPQFPNWFHIARSEGGFIELYEGFFPEELSLVQYFKKKYNLFNYEIVDALKKYDGIFIDMREYKKRYDEWDGKGRFDISDLIENVFYE